MALCDKRDPDINSSDCWPSLRTVPAIGKAFVMAPGTDLSVLATEVATAEKHHTTLPQKNPSIAPIAVPTSFILRDPSLVTQDFDELRFEAATLGQLYLPNAEVNAYKENTNSSLSSLTSSLLISSPYNNPGHYLDLSELDVPNQTFAKALAALKPTRPDYATAPYIEALDFGAVLQLIRRFAAESGYAWKEHTFYVVIFRSQLKTDIDSELLYKLDYESHREACESGGLLKYWFGKVDDDRRNLATCGYTYSLIEIYN